MWPAIPLPGGITPRCTVRRSYGSARSEKPAASIVATADAYDYGLSYDINSRYCYLASSDGLTAIETSTGAKTVLTTQPVDGGVSADEDWVASVGWDGTRTVVEVRQVGGLAVARYPFGPAQVLVGPGSIHDGKLAVELWPQTSSPQIRVIDLVHKALVPGAYTLSDWSDPSAPAFAGSRVAFATSGPYGGAVSVVTPGIWKATTLASTPGDGAMTGVAGDGDRLIWREIRFTTSAEWTLLRSYDASSGAVSTLYSASQPSSGSWGYSSGGTDPWDVSGQRLAWAEPLADGDMYTMGTLTGTDVVTRLASETATTRMDDATLAPADQVSPQMGDGYVCWLDDRAYSTGSWQFDLYSSPTSGGPESLVATSVTEWGPGFMSGTHAIWAKEDQSGVDPGAIALYIVDLATSHVDTVTANLGSGWYPYPSFTGESIAVIAGDWVYFNDGSLHSYRISTGARAVVAAGLPVGWPVLGSPDGKAVFVRNGARYVYDPVAKTTTLLPAAFAGLFQGFSSVDWPHAVASTGFDLGPVYGYSMGDPRAFIIDPCAFNTMTAPRQSGLLALLGDSVFDMRTGMFYRAQTAPSGSQSGLAGTMMAVSAPGTGGAPHVVWGDIASSIWNPTRRLAGTDRAGTAVALSQDVTSAATVVVTTGRAFPDALAGGPLAYALKAPLLLVEPHSVPASVSAEITRLGATNAIILGGTGSVAADVASALAGSGMTVERIGGTDRFQTAALIAQRLKTELGGGPLGQAFIVDGYGFPDALSAAPVAAKAGAPILLSRTTSIPGDTSQALQSIGATHTVVVGAVSSSLPYPAPTRLAGRDRYETCRAVAEHGLAHGLTMGSAILANGRDFPDALAAGAFAARQGSPLLLVDSQKAALPGAIAAVLRDHKASVSTVTVAGGEGSVWLPLQEAAAQAVRP